MKSSIAISLIIIAAVFSFVSGYTIGSHSDQAVNYRTVSQSVNKSVTNANAGDTSQEPSAPSGGYGASSGAVSEKEASSPGYGSEPSPAPGYGGAPSPGYGK